MKVWNTLCLCGNAARLFCSDLFSPKSNDNTVARIIQIVKKRLVIPAHVATQYLQAAILNGKQLTREMLQRGADPNTLLAQGNRPLHIAAYTGDEHIVELLISYGARITFPNYQDLTPLDIAIQRGACKVVTTMLQSDQRQEVISYLQDKRTWTRQGIQPKMREHLIWLLAKSLYPEPMSLKQLAGITILAQEIFYQSTSEQRLLPTDLEDYLRDQIK